MPVFDDLGQIEAIAELAVARAIGVKVFLTHQKDTPVELYVNIVSERHEMENVSSRRHAIDINYLTLIVPVQTGLSHSSTSESPICEGDKVSYLSRYYVVWGPVEVLSNGYMWRVTCREERSHAVGLIG
jgi:hypothetical protein